MPNDYKKFSAGITEKGIDNFNPDFNSNLVLSDESQNMMSGINRGTGPRYGMSPIPGQSCLDVNGTGMNNGLRASESASGSTLDSFINRYLFLGVIPVAIGSYDDLTVKGRMFLWLISDKISSTYYITATPNSVYTDGGASKNLYKYSFNASYGFNPPLWDQPTDNGSFGATYVGFLSPIIKRIGGSNPSTEDSAAFTKRNTTLVTGTYFASVASLTVSGSDYPQKWLVGAKISDGDNTHTATANMIGDSRESYGICPAWNLRSYNQTARDITFYNMVATQLSRTYIYPVYSVDNTTYVATFNQDHSTSNYSLTGAGTPTANERGAAFVAANIDTILLNDNLLTCNSSYRIVLMAAKKAYGFIVQDWERDFEGRNVQIAGLLDRVQKPLVIQTANGNGGSGSYTELGAQVSTCFQRWPSWDGSTPLPKNSAGVNTANTVVTLGAAESGILRKTTDYEFTFAVFDKQFGTETNVGTPVKFRTADEDFVALSIYRDVFTGGQYRQFSSTTSGSVIDGSYWYKTAGVSTSNLGIYNYIELRFYYRELGSYEWLPALFVDYAKFLYYPNQRILWACQGDIAALPGGQPAGFNDYSFLPDDQYECVVNFRQRAYWFSRNNCVYSLRNNPFAYPLRNSAPAPTGGYRGAIIHTYRGQSEQSSRLIIFGQKEIYIGRFTGALITQPVVVSPDSIADLELDGSDFAIEPWTSITAFSYRSAVVADGDLYWWGPQGIYKDDGVGNPVKISKHLEPDIFDLYDSSLVDEIHCIYDEKTKDIIWFYPPKTANTITHSLRYDIEEEEFFVDVYKCKIDWATRIDTTNPGVTQNTNALRTIISAREDSSATIQRGYFFDQINRSGDYSPTRELLVKNVAAGASSLLKVLTFDAGLDATKFATIAVGDLIAVQQFNAYTGGTTGTDMIAKVSAINLITPSLTILMPSGGVLPTGSLASRFYFPIWHKAKAGDGINGIPWVWQTKYWLAGGINYSAIWRYIYMFFKYTAWLKSGKNSISLGYRTPSGGATITDTLDLVDNSDGNCQIFHPLRMVNRSNQGQAIKLRLSGSHIGEEWMLQYLEAHTDEETGDLLKEYEG